MADRVNHPPHYNQHPSGVECIQIVEHFNFNIGNAIKYLWRAGLKNSLTEWEDLKKAAWYVNREVERLEKECGNNQDGRTQGETGDVFSTGELQPETSPTVPGSREGTDPPWTKPVSDRAEAEGYLRSQRERSPRIQGGWWDHSSSVQSEGTQSADPTESTDTQTPEERRNETKPFSVSQRVRELAAELIRLTNRRDAIRKELLLHASQSSGPSPESSGAAPVRGTTAPGPRPGDS